MNLVSSPTAGHLAILGRRPGPMEPILDRSGALSVSFFGDRLSSCAVWCCLSKNTPWVQWATPSRRGPSSSGGNLAPWYLAWRRTCAENRRRQALETRPPTLCRNRNGGQLWPPHKSFANRHFSQPFGSLSVALCRKQACCMDAYLRLLL